MESLPIIKHVVLQGVGTHKFHAGFLKLNHELIQSAWLSQKAKGPSEAQQENRRDYS